MAVIDILAVVEQSNTPIEQSYCILLMVCSQHQEFNSMTFCCFETCISKTVILVYLLGKILEQQAKLASTSGNGFRRSCTAIHKFVKALKVYCTYPPQVQDQEHKSCMHLYFAYNEVCPYVHVFAGNQRIAWVPHAVLIFVSVHKCYIFISATVMQWFGQYLHTTACVQYVIVIPWYECNYYDIIWTYGV